MGDVTLGQVVMGDIRKRAECESGDKSVPSVSLWPQLQFLPPVSGPWLL